MTTPAPLRGHRSFARVPAGPAPVRRPAEPVRPAATVPAPRRPGDAGGDEGAAAMTVVTPRDRSILMAVAAGRCSVTPEAVGGLLVDGHPCADQFAGARLVRAGLVRVVPQPPGRPSSTELTPTAISLLGLPITV